MNCKRCNHPMENDALFCHHCEYSQKLEEQRERYDRLKADRGRVVLNKCHSLLFLVFTIMFTAMTACFVVSAVLGGILSIMGAGLPLVFMIIATVGLWKCYSAKSRDQLADSLKTASIYDGYINVLLFIGFIVVSIAFFVVLALLGKAGNETLSGVGGFVDALVIYLLVAGAWIAIKSWYERRRKIFVSLKVYCDGGEYTLEYPPMVGSIILGAYFIFSALSTIIFASLMEYFIGEIFDLAGDLGAIGDVIGAFEDAMVGMSLGTIIGGMSNILLGVYCILSGIWMSLVHRDVLCEIRETQEEKEAFFDLEKRTNHLISNHRESLKAEENRRLQAEKEAKQARVEAERIAEEEAKKERAAKEEQQMLMMNAMMQQMMAQNGMVAPAVMATPVDDERVLQLKREKEEAEKKAKLAEEQQKMMMQMMQQMMANMNNSSQDDSKE